LEERFIQALRIACELSSDMAPAKTSYQAFIKLLVRWTPNLRKCLVQAFQSLMERTFPDHFRFAGYLLLGGDGSKLQLARTLSNENRYSPTKRGQKGKKGRKAERARRRARSRTARLQQAKNKKSDSPQMTLTLLFHVMLRLPWDWRLGASDTSEREQLRAMIPDLPPESLIVADCGFSGYEFWSELLASERQFVIRVGGNVRLLKKLGTVRESDGTVYLWPASKRRQEPLVLRLVIVHDGRQPWYLVTSIRDPRRLSDRDVAAIYKWRWRIELFFRHFKQTYGRGKLRSHKAEHAECEAEWSLLGLWALLLHAQLQHQQEKGMPANLSVARILRAIGRAIDEHPRRRKNSESLTAQLLVAEIDSYRRKNKRSRNYPRKKYESAAKPPRIIAATPAQRRLATSVMSKVSSRRLPA
jgi:hypothetical protein